MAHDDGDDRPEGFDTIAVERWMGRTLDPKRRLQSPVRWQRLPGGHSNLTYRLSDDRGRRLVFRRSPLGPVLPKAHDMMRESTVLMALAETDVPVPLVVGRHSGDDLIGAPFYVMTEVAGRALYTAEDVDEWLPISARSAAADAYVITLARLHSLDPVELGLGRLGRHDGYVARQLRAWYGSWRASIDAADYDDRRVHGLHDRLAAAIPEQGPPRLVHGDYGMHNCLFDRRGRLTAVLDWELATLGDPLADLAYAVNGWSDPADAEWSRYAVVVAADSASTASGFPRREDLIRRYRDLSGRDLDDLDFYRAFNYLKTACILHGVLARYRQGIKDAGGVDLGRLFDRMRASIELAAITAGVP